MERCLHTSGSSAGEPGASLDTKGRSLKCAYSKPALAASLNAEARRGRLSLSPTRCSDTRSGSFVRGVGSHPVACAAPPPSPARTGESTMLSQTFAWDGMRARHDCSVAGTTRYAALQSLQKWRGHLHTCVV
jgi:hypothetical protein